jgi:hypothetical protein
MATGPGFPQGNNTYVPPDISGRLRIGFSRNPKDFRFPRYWQYVETPFSSAYYLRLTTQEAGRVINTTDFEWPDGAPDRLIEDGTESHNFVPFTTDRRSYKFRIGDKAAKQAAWDILEQHATIKAGQLMTSRSVRGLTVATTAANWQASGDTANLSVDHTATATSLAGGKFDVGSSTSPFIRIGLGKVADIVNQDTLGVVNCEPGKMFLVMNPTTARSIAKSAEIVDYMKGSPHSYPSLAGTLYSDAGTYNLPPELFGYTVIVENAVRTTNKKGGAKAVSYCIPNDNILVVSRVGGLDGIYGAPSFSTLTMFWWQDELTVESNHIEWDRMTVGRCTEDTFEAVTCPASGYLITATSN